jgi:hypothetical protein
MLTDRVASLHAMSRVQVYRSSEVAIAAEAFMNNAG